MSSDKYVRVVMKLSGFMPIWLYSTKDAMLGYMKEQNMPWLGLDFESPLGEQLRSDFKCVPHQ